MEGTRSRSHSPDTQAEANPRLASCRRVSFAQQEALVGFLEGHIRLARGSFSSGIQGSAKSKRLWTDVADLLNKIDGGAIKDGRQWSQYWSGYKNKLKGKVRKVRESIRGTGGGPSSGLLLNEFESRVLALLGSGFVAPLPNVQVDPHINEDPVEALPEEPGRVDFPDEPVPELPLQAQDGEYVVLMDSIYSDELSVPAQSAENSIGVDAQVTGPSVPAQSSGNSIVIEAQVHRPLASQTQPSTSGARVREIVSPPLSTVIGGVARQSTTRQRRRQGNPAPSVLDVARATVTDLEVRRTERERRHQDTIERMLAMFGEQFDHQRQVLEELLPSLRSQERVHQELIRLLIALTAAINEQNEHSRRERERTQDRYRE